MHLADIVGLRTVPASAVFMALTRRCPLSCRHCSTNSMMGIPDNSVDPFLRLVGTFTPDSRPDVVMMSGGEALLKAEAVRSIAESARQVGASSYVLSGMYFARERRMPAPVRRAIDAVDHFAASIDAYHEEEVSRSAVIGVLRSLVDEGKDVSVQVVGLSDDDPYLEGVITDLREALDHRVPILVGHVGSTGRAAEWLHHEVPPVLATMATSPNPCSLACWPLVRFDGKVVACCNQDVVDKTDVPAHLALGDAMIDDWQTIHDRAVGRDMLRGIRLLGPEVLAASPGACSPGYCATCVTLSDNETATARAAELAQNPRLPILENAVANMAGTDGAVGFVRRAGSARYAHLVTLGLQERESACVS